jgi:hypothetical protein
MRFDKISLTVLKDRRAKLRAYDSFGSFCRLLGLTEMHYRLSFLDETGHVRELCKSDFETECTVILWMQVVGAERALHSGWAMMELRCRQRCVARVQAQVLRRAGIPAYAPLILINLEASDKCIVHHFGVRHG